MSPRFPLFAAAALAALASSGCMTNPAVAVFDGGSQVQLRSFQTRAFDTADRVKLLRNIIATMQDLGFVIDKADATLGSVSGTKLAGYELKLTVSVRPRGMAQHLVRANAQYKGGINAASRAVEEPACYQALFAALDKSMFLTAHAAE